MRLPLGRFFWKLFLVNTTLITVVLVASLLMITGRLHRITEQETWDYLEAQARALDLAVRDRFDEPDVAALASLAKKWGSLHSELRLTFVSADGMVLGDSVATERELPSHADRPEIRQAIQEGRGQSRRWSHTVSREMQYVAIRVGSDAGTHGVIRVAVPVGAAAGGDQGLYRLVGTIAVACLASAAVLAMALAMLWSRRIAAITEAANRLARGDLRARAQVAGRDEVAKLARSLNRMGDRLARQLETSERQRGMWESLLGQLREGVVVADAEGKIVLANEEARRLLQINPAVCDESLLGCTVEECIRPHELQQMLRGEGVDDGAAVETVRAGDERAGPGVTFSGVQELKLRVGTSAEAVTLLARTFDITLPGYESIEGGPRGPAGSGRVLLLTDVTELTRLLQMKADFAANASHELRTPLAAIRAAVDTLRSMNGSGEAPSTAYFVEMIARHSSRMEAMVADLLELSRLESPTARFEPAPVKSSELFDELRAAFVTDLEQKNLRWEATFPADADEVVANPHLLGVVLRNLVENSIRFTDPGGEVRVLLRPGDGIVRFDVIDNGCGIPTSEQARVFERFYQVQRARSGADRGTGLGLSIVRHAVAAMNGSVELESEVGKGTRVTITLPQPPRGPALPH